MSRSDRDPPAGDDASDGDSHECVTEHADDAASVNVVGMATRRMVHPASLPHNDAVLEGCRKCKKFHRRSQAPQGGSLPLTQLWTRL